MFAKILDLYRVHNTHNAKDLFDSAKLEAEKLGESFVRIFEERDQKFDKIISQVVQHLLMQRKKKVVVCYLNKEDPIKSL